jgi:hypothetical protein
MNIHRGLHPTRYNIIMFIRVFYWLIKVDVINCCLIHNTMNIWENDIARNEYNQQSSQLLLLARFDTTHWVIDWIDRFVQLQVQFVAKQWFPENETKKKCRSNKLNFNYSPYVQRRKRKNKRNINCPKHGAIKLEINWNHQGINI